MKRKRYTEPHIVLASAFAPGQSTSLGGREYAGADTRLGSTAAVTSRNGGTARRVSLSPFGPKPLEADIHWRKQHLAASGGNGCGTKSGRHTLPSDAWARHALSAFPLAGDHPRLPGGGNRTGDL